MKTLLQKFGFVLVALSLTFTACKKNEYISTNSKRIKHQQSLKGKYDAPTAKLAKGSKLKGEY